MSVLYAFVIALISACGVYLVLSRHIVRTLLGIALISAAVNLLIFYAGRIGASAPPVIAPGEVVLPATAANPLPQALVLTAILIGFALTAFGAALALRIFTSMGSLDIGRIDEAERLGSPFEDGGAA